MQRKVLITGASGFLGRYLLKHFPGEAQVLAQFFTHPVHPIRPNISTVRQDLLLPKLDELMQFEPDVIVHTAAISSIDTCESNPDLAWSVNFEATQKLSEIAKQNHARFIFVSTDTVFDGERGNYSERDTPNPLNIYALTKFESEKYILKNLNNGVIVRSALFYGMSLNGSPSFTQVMLDKLKAGDQVTVFTDQYRSPVPVANLAQAIWELVEMDFRGIIHIGGNEQISRSEMGVKLCRQFDLPLELLIRVSSVKSGQATPRPLDCSFDISFSQSLLKTTFPDFAEGLRSAFLLD